MKSSLKMHWKKLGHVYGPTGELSWAKTHAYLPTPFLLNETTIRVYCAFLDEQKIGRIGYVDVDSENPIIIKNVSPSPVLNIGNPGMFDEHGVNPTSIVRIGDELHLYYLGWQRLQSIPYLIFTGLAISNDGGDSFKRYSEMPVLGRSSEEAFIRSCGTVIKEQDCWKMWYACGKNWINTETGKLPWYEIRYLESTDGINWGNAGRTCMSPVGDDEFGFGRPSVTHDESIYTLWSSVRTRSMGYRFVGAQSTNGKTWNRLDHLFDIDVSKEGWDSQMVCFPATIKVENRTFLFYNGNKYGETGFGVAKLINQALQ